MKNKADLWTTVLSVLNYYELIHSFCL